MSEFEVRPGAGDLMVMGVADAARQGRFRLALRLAEAAGPRARQDPLTELTLANLRGGIAFELGQLDEAERWLEWTLQAAHRREVPAMAAKAATNLGSIAHLRGKVVLALELYQAALECHRRLGNRAGEAQVQHNLAIIHRERGEPALALAWSECAVASARETDDAGLLGTVLAGTAESALAMRALPMAARRLAEARNAARLSGDRVAMVDLRRLRAALAIARGRPGPALRHAAAGYLRALQVGCPQLAGECAALGARAARQLDRRCLARAFLLRASLAFRTLGAARHPVRIGGSE